MIAYDSLVAGMFTTPAEVAVVAAGGGLGDAARGGLCHGPAPARRCATGRP
jgi:hypothetical protein